MILHYLSKLWNRGRITPWPGKHQTSGEPWRDFLGPRKGTIPKLGIIHLGLSRFLVCQHTCFTEEGLFLLLSSKLVMPLHQHPPCSSWMTPDPIRRSVFLSPCGRACAGKHSHRCATRGSVLAPPTCVA